MPTPATSRAALRAIYKTLPARRREVLDELFIRPGQTARSIDAQLGPSAHKRLTELEAAGLAFKQGTAKDLQTNQTVAVWWPHTGSAHKPPPKRAARRHELVCLLRALYGDLTTSATDADPGAILDPGPLSIFPLFTLRPGGIVLVAGDKLARRLEAISAALERESANSPTGGF